MNVRFEDDAPNDLWPVSWGTTFHVFSLGTLGEKELNRGAATLAASQCVRTIGGSVKNDVQDEPISPQAANHNASPPPCLSI
jgi:hypothetical protein